MSGGAVSAADQVSVVGTWRVKAVVAECTINGLSCRSETEVTRATWTVREQLDSHGRRHVRVKFPPMPGVWKTIAVHRQGRVWVGVAHYPVLTCPGVRGFSGTGSQALSITAARGAMAAEMRLSGRVTCPGQSSPETLKAVVNVRGRRAR